MSPTVRCSVENIRNVQTAMSGLDTLIRAISRKAHVGALAAPKWYRFFAISDSLGRSVRERVPVSRLFTPACGLRGRALVVSRVS